MMRLQRLDLEFFGHFTGKTLDFGTRSSGASDFHLIYGSNEAGKTTIMEGYLRLLYGFRPREPYDFKHTRPNLKVSGALMLEDTVREFTRLPGRNNNLVDTSGTPLPEAILQSELSGLSIDDYRNLFCLDDATIEEGGDEIVTSKGDIGRLLFSAAAGVSDLSEILDIVDKRATDLYRKGGSTSEFAQLKRTLDKVSTQIRETDISLSVYRQRKQSLEDAEAFESELRVQRLEMQKEQTRLAATAKAIPIFTKIAGLERELEPLSHFPMDLDIDPEGLVELSKQLALLEAEQNRLKVLVDEKTRMRDAIESQPEVVKVLNRLNDMRELRARCGTATTDLPRQKVQSDGVIEDMKRSLIDMGLESVAAPDQFVFDLTYLRELEKKHVAVTDVEALLGTAKGEEDRALQEYVIAEKVFAELPVAADDCQDLRSILDTHGAPSILVEANKATEALRLAQQSAYAALSQLTFEGVKFETVPELPINPEEASKLALDVEAAKAAIVSAENDLSEAVGTAEHIDSRIDALNDSAGLITDEDAGTSRDKRDELWRDHRVQLSDSTAESFESAMRLDDVMGMTRHSQVKELAEIRQLKVTLAEAHSRSQAKKVALETSRSRLVTIQSELKSYLSAVGLKTSTSAAGFADWVRKVDMARECTTSAENEEIASAPALCAAESLRKKLALALNAPDGKLDALVVLGDKTVAEHEKAHIELRAARKAVDNAKAEHQRRSGRATEAAEKLDIARTNWINALKVAFGDAGQAIQFPHAFDSLRAIRELNEKLLGLLRQIDSMETDRKMFEEGLSLLIKDDSDSDSKSLIDAYDTLVSSAEAASRDDEVRSDLAKEIDDAQSKLESARDDMDDIAAQVRITAAIFVTEIPTSSVEELRQAVLRGNRAISMRDEIGNLCSELCLLLGVSSRSEAEIELESQTLAEVQAVKSSVERDLSVLNDSVDTAIEKRTHAKSALDAIAGDAEVASLVSHRQTIELEMESVILNYFKLKVGHMLADKAIFRYREVHRSDMMKAAEAAFTELTNKAYGRLTTQVNGTRESLVAIKTSDGAAKEAHAMSKGTRFQLYLALRAAAYEQMAANGTILPFFCDDVFETFDEDRTRAACGMMLRIGQTGQAIYLTHHRHVVDIAKEVCGDNVRVHDISTPDRKCDFPRDQKAA